MHPIDHIGIAVRDIQASIAEYSRNLLLEVEHRESLVDRNVELVFLKLPNTRLELISPIESKSDDSLQAFLDKHGEGLHHICYAVPDIRAELTRLRDLGHTLLDEKPRQGAFGSEIAFIHPKSMGGILTELCQHKS